MDKKELIKSVVLLVLVTTSIFLSYLITNYKPKYDILSNEIDKKIEENFEKQKRNAFNVLSPYIVVKHTASSFSERNENAIIKSSDTPIVKDSKIIGQMLENISSKEVDYSRVRNHSIKEVVDQSKTYYTMQYQTSIDSVSAKHLYFANTNNQNSSVEFDRVMISDFSKNSIYLYKSGTDSYMQVFFKEDIFPSIEDIFKNNSKIVSKYLVGTKDVYIEKDLSSYRLDEYDVKSLDISAVASDMFNEKTGVKINSIEEGFKEATDGYAILRETDSSITYINPSNANVSEVLKNNEVQVLATNELIKGYLPDLSYSISEIQKNEIKFRESYNSANVYAGDYPSQISILVNKTGVHRQVIPRIERNQLISSKELPIFHLENIDAVMNYLYENLNIKEIDGIELAYVKKYNARDKRLSYSPAWYVKYQNNNYSFTEIKDKFKKE